MTAVNDNKKIRHLLSSCNHSEFAPVAAVRNLHRATVKLIQISSCPNVPFSALTYVVGWVTGTASGRSGLDHTSNPKRFFFGEFMGGPDLTRSANNNSVNIYRIIISHLLELSSV